MPSATATLISPGAIKLGLSAAPRNALPGAVHTYELRHLFTTQQGSWDPAGRPYDVPDWARSAYLKPGNAPDYFDDAGGDHHLFARVEDEAGTPIPATIRFWSRDGLHIDSKSTGDKKSGWANIPIWSTFNPDRGERGAWLWGPDGALAVADGGGLPNNEHVSSFAVWRRVAVTTNPEQPDQPTEPDQPPPPQTIPDPWFYHLPDAYLIAALAWGEASGESVRGQIAVMNVVCNRVKSPRWSKQFRDVILQPSQFDGLARLGTTPRDIPLDLYALATMAYNWFLSDITDGATHFCRVDASPYWRPLLTYKGRIGNHDFFREE